jgi:esterase
MLIVSRSLDLSFVHARLIAAMYEWIPYLRQLGTSNGSDRIFRGETLFVAGGRSNYLQETDLPLIANAFPSSHVQIIPDAGHWVHSEKPKEFLQAVIPFLQSG